MQNSDLSAKAVLLADQLRCGFSASLTADLIQYIDATSNTISALPPAAIVEAHKIIEQLLHQYEKQDWLGVADTIQYELNALLYNA